jgi:hypothetical protein
MRPFLRNSLVGVTLASFLLAAMPLPAVAGMIGTAVVVDGAARSADLERVNAVLARADIQQRLASLGVDPQDAARRAVVLTPAELGDFARQLEQAPAGADGALAIIGIAFVVLLVLEYSGAIDIFKKV